MDIHYNAFISYRHHPADIKVAQQIHRGLERYKIPRSLKKSKATKLRLFRDKEELPASSNLSDDITKALNHSDFLIVICSTHTKESQWVQREIETFLQTHDHDHVLTVLVDGDPQETIPKILCGMERVDPITGETLQIPLEPLSCDWRGNKAKAYRQELPRLAAALFGCGYDELRQRERQYRAKRNAVILSAAMALVMAFSSYVIYNSLQIRKANRELEQANMEIRKNLEESQRNQSQYLTTTSQQQLSEGDRMLAIALAMAALPEYEGQRPYLPQAEMALCSALGAYNAESDIAAVGSISCDALIRHYEATNDRDRMFVFDQRKVLSVWNLENYQKLKAVQLEEDVTKMLVTAQDHLILVDLSYVVRCYDKELNLLWQADSCNDMVLSDTRDVLLVKSNANTIAFLNAETGEPICPSVQVKLPEDDPNQGWSITFRQESYNLDRPLLLEYSNYSDVSKIISVDADTGKTLELTTISEDYYVRGTAYTYSGDVLVLTVSDQGSWNGTFLGVMLTYSQVPIEVLCLNPDGGQRWTAELTTYSYSSEWTLYAIAENDRVFCQVDNMLAVLDGQSGEILNCCETGANPVWVSPNETRAMVLLEDGRLGNFIYEDREFNSIRYFKEGLDSGFAGKGMFVKQYQSTDILVYNNIMDENWQVINGEYATAIKQSVGAEDFLAVYNYDAVLLFDVQQKKLIWSLEEESGMHLSIVGFSEDAGKLWLGNNGKELICVDTGSVQTERYLLPENHDEKKLYYWQADRNYYADGMIFVPAKLLMENDSCLVAFDTLSEETYSICICKATESFGGAPDILAVKDKIAYCWDSANAAVYKVDIFGNTSEIFLEDVATRPVMQVLNDGATLMVAANNRVTFTDETGELFNLELGDNKGLSAYRTQNQIILLIDSGDFVRYDLNGCRLGEIAGYQYSNFFSNVSHDYDPQKITWTELADGDIFVNVYQSGNLIDMENWDVRAWVPNCLTYDSKADRFVTLGTDPDTGERRFGTYGRYTLEQLMAMAQKALNGYELTQEQMEKYGIS